VQRPCATLAPIKSSIPNKHRHAGQRKRAIGKTRGAKSFAHACGEFMKRLWSVASLSETRPSQKDTKMVPKEQTQREIKEHEDTEVGIGVDGWREEERKERTRTE